MEDWILSESEMFVHALYKTRFPPWRTFHNIHHTEGVVKACRTMTAYYGLDEKDSRLLVVSAWFHDVGYCRGADGHEKESSDIALAFLSSLGLKNDILMTVDRLIQSTIPSHRPNTLEEQIIRDCDLRHLALPEYEQWSLLLKREIEHDRNMMITETQWCKSNIQFFENHKYHTDYALQHWKGQKQINFNRLVERYKDSRF